MPIEITMPRLSDTMETGTVIKWHVKEGDAVSAGDVLADIETDKATMDLESYDDGTVAKILIGEGEPVDVGQPILLVAEEDEDPAEVAASRASGGSASSSAAAGAHSANVAAGAEDRSSTAVAVAPPPGSSAGSGTSSAPATNGAASSERETPGGRVFASPLARKIADEKGLDLATIEGTGPSSRITKKDVEAALGAGAPSAPPRSAPRPPAAQPTAPAAPASVSSLATQIPGPTLEKQIVPLSNMRRTIAKRLVESSQTVPEYQVTIAARMDALLSLRAQLNEQLAAQGVKLSVNDFLVRACALAMHEHPFINSRWIEAGPDGGPAIEIQPEVNIGVAIALPIERGGGLVVATLRDADRSGLRLISQRTKELASKAREHGLTVDEMSDSTFTISNLGMFGVEHFTAIINTPNVCILAVGAAVKKPIVEGDEIVIGREMRMTLASDHRVIDGAMAAQYLATVRSMLENPATLLV